MMSARTAARGSPSQTATAWSTAASRPLSCLFGWETEDMALFQVDRRWRMFLFCSHEVKPPFQAALDADPGKFGVLRGQGRQRRDLGMALLRDDAQRYSFGVSKLSSDEARRIGKAI